MKYAAIGLLIAIAPGAAIGAVPQYDANAYCQRVVSSGGTFSNTLYNTCIDMEQTSYNKIKPVWDNLSRDIRNYCHRIVTSGGIGSYVLLETCVQMELDAASSKKNFKH